jgi:hypothetical protein
MKLKEKAGAYGGCTASKKQKNPELLTVLNIKIDLFPTESGYYLT